MSSTTTSTPTAVTNYTPLTIPSPTAPYNVNSRAQQTNLVAFDPRINSRLDDAIWFSKNTVAAATPGEVLDPYQFNHLVQWSTNIVPAPGAIL